MGAFERLRETWVALGDEDPFWAILSDPRKRGGRWDVAEFFAAGEAEIAALDATCVALALPQARRSALDFGCGVGRLSRALAARYASVVGVDISTSMIAHARRLNADRENLQFVENAQADLRFVDDASVDLVYSVITLQHIPAELQLAYIGEFLRILAPGGLAVFQVACGHARDLRGAIHRFVPNALLNPLRRWRDDSRAAFEMHVVAESAIRNLVARHGLRVVRVDDDACAGAGFVSRRFLVA
jgi:SAM-dependent methyltransferase